MALLPVAPLALALPVTAAPEPDDDDDDDDGPVFPEPDPKPQVYAVPLQHLGDKADGLSNEGFLSHRSP
jgi:hypothetical protein